MPGAMAATHPPHARPDGLPSGEFRERRDIRDIPTRVDRLFDRITFTSGMVVLLLLLLVGYFLLLRSRLAFQSQGMGFFTRAVWNTANGKPALGVLGLLVGTIVVAVIAIAVALPLAVCAALFITEYAPPRWQRTLTSFIDLFAAIPSLIYGLWGVVVLAPQVGSLSGWITRHFGWVPFLSVHPGADLLRSFFIAGLVVALMCLPIIASVVREVFAQCPAGEKEAALALGGTRWGMVRSVVLPYGRGGIIGGSMLGLGRALGETIAVALILPQTPRLWGHILESGGGTVGGLHRAARRRRLAHGVAASWPPAWCCSRSRSARTCSPRWSSHAAAPVPGSTSDGRPTRFRPSSSPSGGSGAPRAHGLPRSPGRARLAGPGLHPDRRPRARRLRHQRCSRSRGWSSPCSWAAAAGSVSSWSPTSCSSGSSPSSPTTGSAASWPPTEWRPS